MSYRGIGAEPFTFYAASFDQPKVSSASLLAAYTAKPPSSQEATPQGGLSDAAFYGGLAALGAVAALGVWYAVRRLRPWH